MTRVPSHFSCTHSGFPADRGTLARCSPPPAAELGSHLNRGTRPCRVPLAWRPVFLRQSCLCRAGCGPTPVLNKRGPRRKRCSPHGVDLPAYNLAENRTAVFDSPCCKNVQWDCP